MLYEAMQLSAFGYFIVIAVCAAVVAFILGRDEQIGAVVFAGIVLAALTLFTSAFRSVSLFWIVVLIPLYFLIGTGWAIYRWRGYVLAAKAQAREDFKSQSREQDFPTWFAANPQKRPTASGNKERLTGWIALWPWSMLWGIAKFPWRLAQHIWTWLAGTFERMSERLWAQ